MKHIENYFDAWNLIAQSPTTKRDGGDACNRFCSYHFSMWFRRTVLKINTNLLYPRSKAAQFLEGAAWLEGHKDGRYRRHPNPEMWYRSVNTLSRDQLIPLIIMLGLTDKKRLWNLFKQHAKHLFLTAWNTQHNWIYKDRAEHERRRSTTKWRKSKWFGDFTGPEIFALYVRSANAWFLWPLLCILDAETLIGTIGKRFSKSQDVINHCTVVAFGRVRLVTPFSWLANKWLSHSDMQEKLNSFFGPEVEPPLNEMYKPILGYLKNK